MKRKQIRYFFAAALLGAVVSTEGILTPPVCADPFEQNLETAADGEEDGWSEADGDEEGTGEIMASSVYADTSEQYPETAAGDEGGERAEADGDEKDTEENGKMQIPLTVSVHKFYGQADPDLRELLREQIDQALRKSAAVSSDSEEASLEEALLAGIHWSYETGQFGEEGEYRPEGESVISFSFDTDLTEETSLSGETSTEKTESSRYQFVLNGEINGTQAILTTGRKPAEGMALAACRLTGLEAGADGTLWGTQEKGVSIQSKDPYRWKVSLTDGPGSVWADSVTWNDSGEAEEHSYYLRDVSPEGNGMIYPVFSEQFGIREAAPSDPSGEPGPPDEPKGEEDALPEQTDEEDEVTAEEDREGEPPDEAEKSDQSDRTETEGQRSFDGEEMEKQEEDADETEASALPASDSLQKIPPAVRFLGLEDGRLSTAGVLPDITLSGNIEDNGTMKVRVFRILPDGFEEEITDQMQPALQKQEEEEGEASILTGTLEQIRENDGVYRMSVSYTDENGETREAGQTEFTVNQFGSVYEVNAYVQKLRGAWVKKVTDALVITEYNPDALVEGSRRVEITRDGVLQKNVRFTVTERTGKEKSALMPENNGKAWHVYDYVISPSNFKEDGIYKVVVTSADQAGNHPESQTDRNKEILFRIDATPPEIQSLTGLEKEWIRKNSQTVSYQVFDALGLKSVEVLCGSRVLYKKTDFSDSFRDSGSFQIPAGLYNKIRVEVTDLAGNVTVRKKTITISGNPLVLLVAEAGSRAAAAVVLTGAVCAGGAAVWMFRKNRRRKKVKMRAGGSGTDHGERGDAS